MYYFNDADKSNGKVVQFLAENHVYPAKLCDEAATPINVEDACRFASNFRTVVITAKVST